MPRSSRLDAPKTVRHVMVRGIERTMIFRDDRDRADFVARLAAIAERGMLTTYAWALLPNHAHLLVHTGPRPLPRSMRSFLIGYAGAFNRRHHRVNHLFQNRYKPIVGAQDPSLLVLARYLHLKPLPAAAGRAAGDSPPEHPPCGYPGPGRCRHLAADSLTVLNMATHDTSRCGPPMTTVRPPTALPRDQGGRPISD